MNSEEASKAMVEGLARSGWTDLKAKRMKMVTQWDMVTGEVEHADDDLVYFDGEDQATT